MPILPILRRWSRGNDVRKLQYQLKEMGYYLGEIDGIFGRKTKEAVKAYQRARGLKQDGIVGPKTWAKLEADQAGKPAIYSQGDKGEYIGQIQKRLQVWRLYGKWFEGEFTPYTIDNDFGPATTSAVLTLQRGMGLLPDGIVGPITIDTLFGEPLNWRRISDKPFICKCGGKYCDGLPDEGIDPALKMQLVRFEDKIGGRPYTITSGYRCPVWNRKAGGATHSQHMYGKAADVYVEGMPVRDVNKIFEAINPHGGVGLNGARITHDDTRGHKSRWSYN